MKIGKTKSTELLIVQGDITQSGMDAIVNAANEEMVGGGGVDGAIHDAAGERQLYGAAQAAMKAKYGDFVPVGKSIITPGFDLIRVGTKYVIHTVGPNKWGHQPREFAPFLEDCLRTSLELGESQGDISTIAYPLISTGIFGVPINDFALAAKAVLPDYNFRNIKTVSLYVFRDHSAEATLRQVIGM